MASNMKRGFYRSYEREEVPLTVRTATKEFKSVVISDVNEIGIVLHDIIESGGSSMAKEHFVPYNAILSITVLNI